MNLHMRGDGLAFGKLRSASRSECRQALQSVRFLEIAGTPYSPAYAGCAKQQLCRGFGRGKIGEPWAARRVVARTSCRLLMFAPPIRDRTKQIAIRIQSGASSTDPTPESAFHTGIRLA